MNNIIIYILSYSLARISLYSLHFTARPESDGDFFDKQKYVQTAVINEGDTPQHEHLIRKASVQSRWWKNFQWTETFSSGE